MPGRLVMLALIILLAACGGDTTGTTPSGTDATAVDAPAESLPAGVDVEPATEPAAGEATVEVVDSSNWLGLSGSLWFVGVVKNTGTVTAKNITVDLTLLDATVATGSDTILTSVHLELGQQGPFRILFDPAPEAWAAENFQVQASTADPADTSDPLAPVQGLTISGDTMTTDEYDITSVNGEVANGGTDTAIFVHVIGAGFDEAGKVVAASDTFTTAEEIAPGESSPFSLSLQTGEGVKIARYELIPWATKK